MAIIRCKVCGGDLNIVDGTTVAVCEYCGTRQTLPKINDEQRAAAFNRGDHFRKISEFDKALSVYERIIAEDDTDAEAHWCAALSRYGIEYVKDPASGEYIPTCHRASFTSFLEDVDYQAAVANADPIAREQYEHDGRTIAEVQRNIIETVNKEAPFDIFICYKETDDRGQRTPDSMLAQDIYYRLTDQGYRVFFSRITFEDKAGQQYEPYIFAALHSAKVMIVIGTRPEYMNAVWVKNEWSRYLALMKNDRSRLLIPCYRDMDPYDMPEQLSILQSYDMSRIGFIQDLIRGISKVIDAEKPKEKETVIVQTASGNTSIDAQIKRGNLALEDGDFQAADGYFDHALDIDPESAEAYLGKTLSNEECNTVNQFIEKHRNTDNRISEEIILPRKLDSAIERSIQNYSIPNYLSSSSIQTCYKRDSKSFMSYVNFLENKLKTEDRFFSSDKWLSKAFRYANGDFKTTLENIRNTILSGIQSELEKAKAADHVKHQRILDEYTQDFQQSEQNAWQMYNQALQKRESDYQSSCIKMSRVDDANKCEKVIADFKKVGTEYKDVASRIEYLEKARTQFLQEQQRELAEQKRCETSVKKKKIITATVSFVIIVVTICMYFFIIQPEMNYRKAKKLFLEGEYDAAIVIFDTLGNYKDSSDLQTQGYYAKGEKLYAAEKYDQAIVAFTKANALEKVRQIYFEKGENLYAAQKYDLAIAAFKNANDFEKVKQIYYEEGEALLSEKNFIRAYQSYLLANGYNDSKDKLEMIMKTELPKIITAGGEHTVLLKSNGNVIATGYNGLGQCNVSGWRDVIAISAGGFHTVGLKSDGTVIAVGASERSYEQCNVSGWRNIIAVSAGRYYTVGLKADGTVVAVGYNEDGQCNVSGWRNIIAVSAGKRHTVGLKSDGTVVTAGSLNAYGQCNVSGWKDIIAVSAGENHTVGLKADGTVVAVGDNKYGQCNVSDWKDIVAISAGESYTVGLKTDGTVIAIGNNEYGQCDVSGWQDIIAISAGMRDSYPSQGDHTIGLKADGTVVAVGYNKEGQCDVSDLNIFLN